MGSLSRPRDRGGHPGQLRRRAPGGPRLALPRPAPAAETGLDRLRVEDHGEQAAGEVLPAHRGRTQAARGRAIALEAPGRGHDAGHASGLGSPVPAALSRVWSRFRAWAGRDPDRTDELDEEIRFHLAEEARLRVERGMTPSEAEASARCDFGNVLRVREVTRAMWGG